MALGAGIQAGKAFVEFLIGDKKLDGQLASIGKKFTKVGSIGAAVTGPIVAGFAAAALTFAGVGSELADMSNRTKATVEDLSELKFAAGQAGVPLGQVEKALRTLVEKGMNPADFDAMAADIAAIPDPADRARAAMELFGAKTGAAILPLLEDLPALRQRARDLGLTMSGESAEAADVLGDAWDTMKDQMGALTVQIGAAIAGPLTEFLKWSEDAFAWVIEFVKEHPKLIAGIAGIAAGIAVASGALITFGTLLTIITLHPIVAALTLITGLFLVIGGYIAATSESIEEFITRLGDAVLGLSPLTAGLWSVVKAMGAIEYLSGAVRDGISAVQDEIESAQKKVPNLAGAQSAQIQAQAQDVQSRLRLAVASHSAGSPTIPAANSAGVAGMGQVAQFTERTAIAVEESLGHMKRLVQFVGRGGFFAGSG